MTPTMPRAARATPLAIAAAAIAGLLLAAAAPVAAPARAQAPEPPTTIVVFDGSGSMWGSPEGERRNKLTLARDALKTGLAAAGAATRVGLVSFGHRRSGDCGDVETIQKPETGATAAIGAALDKLSPRGRGPITAALREAARQLPAAPAPASVILVHDDYDNCQLDPCTAVGDLRRANPKVVVHVVSMLVKREDAQRLQCLARATGGRQWDAQNAAQITVAVDEAVKLATAAAVQPVARPAAPAPAAPATKDAARDAAKDAATPPGAAARPAARPGLDLRAALVEGGAPLAQAVRWRVTKRGDAAAAWEGDAADPLLELASGKYDVEAWLGFVRAKASVDVVAGTAQSLVVALGAGLLQMPPAPPEEGEARRALADVVVTLKRVEASATTVAFQRGLGREIALVPGNYIVGVTAGSARFERTRGIKAGETTAFDADLAFGVAEITTTAAIDVPGNALVALFEDDPEQPQGRREIWRSTASPATMLVAAGTYSIVARRGTAEARERLTIRPGEIERRAIALDLARLTVLARTTGGRIEAGEPVSHRLERLDGDRDSQISSEPQPVFHVAAGRYRIESRVGLANAVAQREVEIRPGAREQVTIELPAGAVRLRWLEQPGGNALADVAWEVRDATGRLVWAGSQTEARPLLLAGRYTVRAEARERRVERPLDVRAGETRTLDIVGQ